MATFDIVLYKKSNDKQMKEWKNITFWLRIGQFIKI